MKLSELLAQEDVQLTPGSYLVSHTMEAGYVPTNHTSDDHFHNGRYLFQVVGVGEADVDGNYAELNIVPLRTTEDGKEILPQLDHPIIVQEGNKVVFSAGRNHPEHKDPYVGRELFQKTDIAVGQEHRQILLAFIEFVNSEFSLGVNDFTVAEPTQLDEIV